MSLRARIAGVTGAAVAVTVLLAAVVVYFATRSSLRGEVDGRLRDRAATLAARPGPPGLRPFRGGIPDPGELGLQSGGEAAFGGAVGYAQFVFPDGTALRARGARVQLPVTGRALAVAQGRAGGYFTDVTRRGTHLRVLTVPSAAGAIQVARPLDEIDAQLRRILLVLALVALGGIALGAGLAALVTRTALAPIERFTRRTEAIAGREPQLSERMDDTGTDELARLARSFNTTLDALEASVAAQRHLVADASHELRTPLASLRANVQVLEDAEHLPENERRALRDDVVAELDELTALVADVVELARGTAPGAELDDVRVDEIAARAVERAERRAAASVDIAARLEPTLVAGEPGRIARAIQNLLDNALKWTGPGGRIDVRLAGGVLEVRDHGPGFDPEDLPHVFERFYRADRARGMPGSGLGLAIVRQAAEAHGGWVEAANAPGGGALLRVSFGPPGEVPAAPPLVEA
jgi:two-component system sensor histidine kinase MprB